MTTSRPLEGRNLLLIIGGGIAAYKTLDLIRRLRERGAKVYPVMTEAAQEFVTPLSVSALAGQKIADDLFDVHSEHDVGHIRMARQADAIIVAPATADRMAKMAHGLGDDLAGAILLAADCPVLAAPAMNPSMWSHPATGRSLDLLKKDGVEFVGPEIGEMAEKGEAGLGRMSEPLDIVARLEGLLTNAIGPLSGMKAIVTSGPTHEPIDPVRYIANRSSGRQGHAIAGALARAGADVTLVSGPVHIKEPAGVRTVSVMTAREMHDAVEQLLPADIAVMVAAVADFRTTDLAASKIKKKNGQGPRSLDLTENPDILKAIAHHRQRPRVVVGFAAETDDIVENARRKFSVKGADLILANDVSSIGGVMGQDETHIWMVTSKSVDEWPIMTKHAVAERLVDWISARMESVET